MINIYSVITKSKRKVLPFTGFHSNAEETFTGIASSVFKMLKKAISQKMHQENLAFHLKLQSFSPA